MSHAFHIALIVLSLACLLPRGAHATDVAELFEGGAKPLDPTPARQLVDDAFQNVFAPGLAMWIETLRTDADGRSERARYLVLRRWLDGSTRVLTESLGPPARMAGTRVLQVQAASGLEATYVFSRSVGRDPIEAPFRLADPFLCTWYRENTPRREPTMPRWTADHEILARRPDVIAGERVQRVMIRPTVSRGYDRFEIAIAERDHAILEYLYFLDPGDTKAALVVRVNREDMMEVDGHVLPRVLRYEDRLIDSVVFVTVAAKTLPPSFSDAAFEPRSFHRVPTDTLGDPPATTP